MMYLVLVIKRLQRVEASDAKEANNRTLHYYYYIWVCNDLRCVIFMDFFVDTIYHSESKSFYIGL